MHYRKCEPCGHGSIHSIAAFFEDLHACIRGQVVDADYHGMFGPDRRFLLYRSRNGLSGEKEGAEAESKKSKYALAHG